MAFEKNYLMLAICIIILGTFASQAATRELYKASIAEKYEQWMAEYGRVYPDSTEKERRFAIFQKNVEFVEQFNNDGEKTYKLSVNQFSDMTDEEFLKHHTGCKKLESSRLPTSSEDESLMYQSLSIDEIPASVDWRERGAVTPIKNQLDCSACWAFAAVAAVEGIIKIKNGQLISLSEQQIVDCDDHLGSEYKNGCEPREIITAFEYIMDHGGIALERNYPYRGTTVKQTCNDTGKATEQPVQISEYKLVQYDEVSLRKAVSMQPVSVAIDVTGPQFRSYGGGVFEGPCGSFNLSHAVTIIGYGTETQSGKSYWLMKNSWGKAWGEQGYMRIRRTTGVRAAGLCGLGELAVYPVMR